MNHLIRSITFFGKMRRYPSPSLVVSITALIVALGGASYSATGGNFILGQSNRASTQTKLIAPIAGPALGIDNLSTGAGAAGLRIVTAATRPPLVVNSSTRVDNLNADKLDGLNSTQFPRTLVISYSIAPGANSAPISVPSNRPVFVMGYNFFDGVGQATLVRNAAAIGWVGLDERSATVSAGFSGTAGTHIIYLDSFADVDIEVNSADSIRIHNGNGTFTRTGTVTLIW